MRLFDEILQSKSYRHADHVVLSRESFLLLSAEYRGEYGIEADFQLLQDWLSVEISVSKLLVARFKVLFEYGSTF